MAENRDFSGIANVFEGAEFGRLGKGSGSKKLFSVDYTSQRKRAYIFQVEEGNRCSLPDLQLML